MLLIVEFRLSLIRLLINFSMIALYYVWFLLWSLVRLILLQDVCSKMFDTLFCDFISLSRNVCFVVFSYSLFALINVFDRLGNNDILDLPSGPSGGFHQILISSSFSALVKSKAIYLIFCVMVWSICCHCCWITFDCSLLPL